MGFLPKTMVLSILVLLIGIAFHEYMPNHLSSIMKSKIVRKFALFSHQFVKNPLYFLNQESTYDWVPVKEHKKNKLFTNDELKLYNGHEGSKGLYLVLLGSVFDVEKGKQFYGPGGGYEFFSGRDGSRAFVSGDFSENGLNDDVSGLTSQDYIGLHDWIQFYHKDYIYVGKLIGRYYDENGEATPYNIQVQSWIQEALDHRDQEDKEKKIFPPCNFEWSPETGSRIYCTKKSGGIDREWVGVPRKIFFPGRENRERCACVKNFGPPSHDPTRTTHGNNGDLDYPNLKEYPGCTADRNFCYLPKD